jgi:hypothetical protein
VQDPDDETLRGNLFVSSRLLVHQAIKASPRAGMKFPQSTHAVNPGKNPV